MKYSVENLTKVKPAAVKSKRRQVGILGGTFDPVHNAHLMIADQVLTQLHLDEIWFIPDNIPPHKPLDDRSDTDERIHMLNLATQDNPRFKVKLFEIMRGGVSYTADTLRFLHRKYPQNDYYLILGSDQADTFSEWHQPEEIVKMATLVGVKRANYPVQNLYPIIWLDVPDLAISSTQIRQAIMQGRSIRYLVPETVWSYLIEKGLYR